jgi:two-component system, NarL family, invasion response regulator UvrY
VLTVDDQRVFLRSASRLIAATAGFVEVGQATSGREALELAARIGPDLVLLDVRIPDVDGIEVARRLLARDPRLLVVLVSSEREEDLPSFAGSVGAAALLSKRELSPRVLRRIWAARAG